MEKLSEPSEAKQESLAEISGRTLDDVSLWVRRDVEPASVEDIDEAKNAFWRDQVILRHGVFTLSLLYPKEVGWAARHTAADSSVGRSQVIDVLGQTMPDSLRKPVDTEVRGLGQFGNKIGIVVGYDEFQEERKVLTDGLNELFGIKVDWNEINPHISIARGSIDSITNKPEIEKALPEIIYLSDAQELKD